MSQGADQGRATHDTILGISGNYFQQNREFYQQEQVSLHLFTCHLKAGSTARVLQFTQVENVRR